MTEERFCTVCGQSLVDALVKHFDYKSVLLGSRAQTILSAMSVLNRNNETKCRGTHDIRKV